ncbi:MAG: hypothetical protein R3B90_07755 [Planctomycetaceae bacterium]
MIEEFDRESELSSIDFGDEDEVSTTETKKRAPRKRTRKAEPAAADDFGADIVSGESSEPAAKSSRAPARRRKRTAESETPAEDVKPVAARSQRDDADDVSFDADTDTVPAVTSRSETRGNRDGSGRGGNGVGGGTGGDGADDGQRGEDGDRPAKRGRRRRRRGRQKGGADAPPVSRGGRDQNRDQNREQSRARDDYPRGGRDDYPSRGGGRGRGGNDRNRQQNRQQNRPRHQKAAVGESHTPPVMSGTFEGVLELHPKQYGFLRTAPTISGHLILTRSSPARWSRSTLCEKA